MPSLIPLSDLIRDRHYDFTNDNIYDPTGKPAYGMEGNKIGTVRGAMVEPETGRLRYLIVDVGGWFVSKEVLVPVGLARVEDDGVYYDNLTKDQVRDMREYRYGEDYSYDAQQSDERVLRGSTYSDSGYDKGSIDNRSGLRTEDSMTLGASTDSTIGMGTTGTSTAGLTGTTGAMGTLGTTGDIGTTGTTGTSGTTRYDYRDTDVEDRFFKTPNRLQLLEERLVVDKDRYVAGSVEIGKHVETRQQQVNVDVSHEELVIERRPVTDSRPVEGNVTLGADRDAIRVDLEAERADIRKQAYVTEEVEIGKRTETETRTFTETVGREVLDVTKTGDVEVSGSDTRGFSTGSTLDNGTRDRGLLDKASDAIDGFDGKIDRDRNR